MTCERRRAGLLAAALAVIVLLSGCVSIPRDGGVGRIVVGEDSAGVQSRIDPDGPVPGAQPDEIVRGFLSAGAGYSNNFEVARSFLTESLARDWNPLDIVRVMSRGTGFADITSEITTDSQQVSLAVPVDSLIDGNRIHRDAASDSRVELDFVLRQVNGEWRIAEAPSGIVLSAANFNSLFQAYPLYFFTPGYEYLVPDVRWFIRSPSSASEVMGELLRGPADHLIGSVVSAVPEGTQLEPRAVTVSEGTADVGLSDTAAGLDERTAARLDAQISETLRQIGSITDVRVATPMGALEPEADAGVETSVQFDSRPVVISEGGLARVVGNRIEPVTGSPELGDGDSLPAVAIDGSMYAYRHEDGAEIRRVLVDGMSTGSVLTGDDLIGPSFDRFGWTWTAEADSTGTLLAVDRSGTLAQISADFLDGRRILRLQLAREGSRLAVLSADHEGRTRLEVIGLTRDSGGAPTGVVSATPLSLASGIERITDFSWAGGSHLVMLGAASAGSSVQPYSVQVSGPVESLGTIDGGVRIAGGGDLRSVRVSTADGELLTYGAGTWQKIVDARAFDPAYPG